MNCHFEGLRLKVSAAFRFTHQAPIQDCCWLSTWLGSYSFVFSQSLYAGGPSTLYSLTALLLIVSLNLLYLHCSKQESLRFLRSLSLLLLGIASLQWVISIHPAQAQGLFVSIEEFLKRCFSVAQAPISLTFNSLRFFVLLYFAWTLASTLRIVKEGESWIAVAQTPALLVLVVGISDAMSTFLLTGVTCALKLLSSMGVA